MAPLTAHLLESGDHGRLGFHPRCPVCRRERLLGILSPEPLISRRAQAALATGVLALSVASPGFALAQERDHQQEGRVAPEQRNLGQPPVGGPGGQGGGELDDPGFDPGGETTLPFDVGPLSGPPQEDGDDGESEPLESEPIHDPDARLAPLSEPGADVSPTGYDAPVPPAESAPPAEPSPETPVPQTRPPSADAPGRPDSSPPTPRRERALEQTRPEQTRTRPDTFTISPQQPISPPSISPQQPISPPPISPQQPISPPPEMPSAAPLLAQASVPAQSAEDAEAGEPGESAERLPSDARFHVVEPGESLWSIATDLLGPRAGARIAREVTRLWELNEDRIGTGNPDVLPIGVKLRLR